MSGMDIYTSLKTSMPFLDNIDGIIKWGCLTPDDLDLDSLQKSFHAWDVHNHGALSYIDSRQELLLDPFGQRPWAQAAIVLAFAPRPNPDSSLRQLPPARPGQPAAVIAGYALGEDYHVTGKRILRQIVALLKSHYPLVSDPIFELCVDSSPVLEKIIAVQANIGTPGCNGLLRIAPWGSLAHLAIMFTNLPLPSVKPPKNNDQTCANCKKCLKACPNNALTANGLMVKKCRAWIANEKRGELTAEEKILLGDALAGCSYCSVSCPDTPPTNIQPLAVDPQEIIDMSGNKLKRIIAGTPLAHLGIKQLRRNAKTAIENQQ